MSYHITTETENDYRCTCCGYHNSDSYLVDDLEAALSELPTEFPLNGDMWVRRVSIKDGSTGKVVASSDVSYPPAWQRSDPYQYTMWQLWIDEEAAPGRGCYTSQIISGTNSLPAEYRRSSPIGADLEGDSSEEEPKPKPTLMDRLVTDKTWSQICDELKEAKRLRDVAKAESDLAEAQKRLERLKKA